MAKETKELKKPMSYAGGSGSGIVPVNPDPSNGLTSKAIDYVEKLIVKLMYGSPSRPLHCLSGNFGPVPETPPVTDLPVRGHLPVNLCELDECLNDEFVRVGPNSKFAPIAGTTGVALLP